jgi:FSR family fosmidomycin resistance protein-like MFS transporter
MGLLFRNKLFVAVTVGHLVIDIFNSMGAVLVTFLSLPMALTTAQIGLAVSLYAMLAAVTQPFFGWLVDKTGSRWMGPGSVAWTISFIAASVLLAQLSNNFLLFMIPFSMAALGSGAFHPMATMHSTTAVAGLAATATGLFFLFGQAGLAGGPALGGLVLEYAGLTGIYLLAALTIPFLIFMVRAMRHTTGRQAAALSGRTSATAKTKVRWGAIGLLALVTGLRSWAFLGTAYFLPKLYQDMGWDAAAYGLITGIYWLASGFSGVMGGGLADRWGRRQVVFVTLLLGSIPLYFIPLQDGWLAYVLVILGGGLLGASHSILVVIAQALLPGRQAFASGVTLGYLFGVGAVAAWCIGSLAEVWGLTPVLQLNMVVGISAALLSLLLPATREISHPQPEGASA